MDYSHSDKTITIKDDEKRQLILFKIIFTVNLLQGIVGLSDVFQNEVDFLTYVKFGLGALSIVMLTFLIFKKTSKDKLKVEEIKSLRERSSFGVSYFSFQLNNGKIRNLQKIRGKAKITALYQLCKEVGITTTYKEVI